MVVFVTAVRLCSRVTDYPSRERTVGLEDQTLSTTNYGPNNVGKNYQGILPVGGKQVGLKHCSGDRGSILGFRKSCPLNIM